MNMSEDKQLGATSILLQRHGLERIGQAEEVPGRLDTVYPLGFVL
jgi:hypothetical protein